MTVIVGVLTTGSVPDSDGARIQLLNGRLAGPGDADATGAIYREGELVGSGVLVAANAILTAGHCLTGCATNQENCKKTAECRFFLPGVGSRRILSCETTVPDADTCCTSTPGPGQPAGDLAHAVLDQPILSVDPVRLPPDGWDIGQVQEARVSGFGINFDDDAAVFKTGLKQFADVPLRECPHSGRICFGNTRVELASNDSGGPVICFAPPFNGLIGISVEAPSQAIRLSGDTLEWARERVPQTDPKAEKRRRFHMLVNEQVLQKDSRRIEPLLRKDEELIITLNAVERNPVIMGVQSSGEKEPGLCGDGAGVATREISRTGNGNQEIDVWFEACDRKSHVQIVYSRDL